MQDAIQTAVGGNAVSQVLQGEQRYDLVLRYQPPYRDTKEAIENIRLLAPTGERVSLAQLCKVEVQDGASEIYREGEFALRRDQVQRARPRPGQHGGRGDQQGGPAGETADGLPHRLGRRVREPEALAEAADDRAADHHPGDLHHSLHHVQLVQVGAADAGQHGHGAARRPAGAAGHRHALQRLLRRRLSGAVRRVACRPA